MMTDNLLINSGFEGTTRPGSYTHDTHTDEVHANFASPSGWVGWWDERQGRRRPETKVIHLEPPFVGPPRRICEGEWGVLMFVSFHPWIGGYYQIVDGLTIGQQYEAGFSAHAWCANDGLPHANDPGCAPMGCGPQWMAESELPLLNGDPVNDAWWAALFQAGVQELGPGASPDPTYGVRWGGAKAIYNVYQPVMPLSFVATTERVAVYLRCAFRWEFRNNDAYLDAAFLRLVEDTPPPPARTYERTYVLLPNMNPFDPAEQARISALNPGLTVGPSADDAAIGHPFLKRTTIICYEPTTWGGRDALEDFWRTYYAFPRPGDVIEYREEHSPPPPPPPPVPNPLLLAQRDPRWANSPFGDGNCHQTIGQAGCFTTCLATAQRFYGIDTEATPVTVDTALGPAGYIGCVANWRGNNSHFKRELRISVSEGSQQQAAVHMAEGACAMADVVPGGGQHFVLVYETDGTYTALDPWANESRPFALSEAESWRILSPVQPANPDTTNRVSLHLQTMVPGVLGPGGFVDVARPQGIKRVTGMQDLETFKRQHPWLMTTYRHDGNPGGGLQFCDPNGGITTESLRVAGDWLARYSDSLIEVASCGLWSKDDPFYMEGPNEYGWAADNPDKIKRAASLERSWLVKLAELNLPVAPVCFCAGVGNIGRPGVEEQDFLLLADLAHETAALGGAFGLHVYWTPGLLARNGKYLAYRFMWIDEVLERDAGVRRLKWKLGEGGVAGEKGNPTPLEMTGWRAPNSHNGDWGAYKAEILEWNRTVQGWNSTHDNRCIELDIFTVGIGVGWLSFLLGTPEIRDLAAALAA